MPGDWPALALPAFPSELAEQMAHVNRVLRSINNEDGSLCVDIFLRPEGTVGFEVYRRDVEDPRGWFPVGGFSSRIFANEIAAFQAAKGCVSWLASVS